MKYFYILYDVVGEKVAFLLPCTREDPKQVHRLERWMALASYFVEKRTEKKA